MAGSATNALPDQPGGARMTPIVIVRNGRREWRPYWKNIGNNNYVAYNLSLKGSIINAIPFKDSEVVRSEHNGACWAVALR